MIRPSRGDGVSRLPTQDDKARRLIFVLSFSTAALAIAIVFFWVVLQGKSRQISSNHKQIQENTKLVKESQSQMNVLRGQLTDHGIEPLIPPPTTTTTTTTVVKRSSNNSPTTRKTNPPTTSAKSSSETTVPSSPPTTTLSTTTTTTSPPSPPTTCSLPSPLGGCLK